MSFKQASAVGLMMQESGRENRLRDPGMIPDQCKITRSQQTMIRTVLKVLLRTPWTKNSCRCQSPSRHIEVFVVCEGYWHRPALVHSVKATACGRAGSSALSRTVADPLRHPAANRASLSHGLEYAGDIVESPWISQSGNLTCRGAMCSGFARHHDCPEKLQQLLKYWVAPGSSAIVSDSILRRACSGLHQACALTNDEGEASCAPSMIPSRLSRLGTAAGS